jgi:hypothetical protein
MRTFALTGLVGVAALNGFLGHFGQGLADNMELRLQTYGATVPAITVFALALPHWRFAAPLLRHGTVSGACASVQR